MGLATHLGPWLLGTVKDGSLSNVGATTVAQVTTNTNNGANTFYLPAGYAILRAFTYFTTAAADTTATVTWNIGGVAFTTAALGASNRIATLSFATATPAQINGTIFNTGAGSVTCTVATNSAAGAQQSINVIEYIVRDPNGNIKRNP